VLRHKGCGGIIKKRKCDKCGKTWGRLGSLVSGDIENFKQGFDPEEYRKRIREHRDLK